MNTRKVLMNPGKLVDSKSNISGLSASDSFFWSPLICIFSCPAELMNMQEKQKQHDLVEVSKTREKHSCNPKCCFVVLKNFSTGQSFL